MKKIRKLAETLVAVYIYIEFLQKNGREDMLIV